MARWSTAAQFKVASLPRTSFSPVPTDPAYGGDFQSDLRMTYCASVVFCIIGDEAGVDVNRAQKMLERCRVRRPLGQPWASS